MLLKRRSEKVEELRKVPLFSGLSNRHLGLIAREADEVSVQEGTVLVHQGRLGKQFMLILKGKAHVEVNGRLIANLDEGDFIGEISLIDGKPSSATVIADTPVTLLVVHSLGFAGLLEEVPGLSKKILRGLCERLREADTALARRN